MRLSIDTERVLDCVIAQCFCVMRSERNRAGEQLILTKINSLPNRGIKPLYLHREIIEIGRKLFKVFKYDMN